VADAIGIPRVLEIVGLIAIAMAVVSVGIQRMPISSANEPAYPGEPPLPGSGVLAVTPSEETP